MKDSMYLMHKISYEYLSTMIRENNERLLYSKFYPTGLKKHCASFRRSGKAADERLASLIQIRDEKKKL